MRHNAVAVSGGWEHTRVALSDGTTQCWGANGHNQLGSENCIGICMFSTPVPIPTVSNAITVSCGRIHSCVLLADGRVKCWGDDVYGELGDGSESI